MKRILMAGSREPAHIDALFGEDAARYHLLYQPLVDLNTGTVAGFSARPVFSDPKYGFQSRTGEAGIGAACGEACLKRACAVNQAMDGVAEWMAEEKGQGVILAGLEPWGGVHCPEGPIGHTLRMLARSGASASRLMILLDADGLMERPAQALDLGIGLKRLGVGVGVDNLIPGEAPYNFLEMFPADLLRVRLDAFDGFPGIETSLGRLPELNAFAENLLMETAVSGVETARQYRLVKSSGCRYAQGGYFSRPLAFDGARQSPGSTEISPYLLGG